MGLMNMLRRRRNRPGFDEDQLQMLQDTCGKVLTTEEVSCLGDDSKYSQESNCSICLGPWESGQDVIEFKLCSHAFHRDCLKDWLKIQSTCPLCKSNKKEEIGLPAEEETQPEDFGQNINIEFLGGRDEERLEMFHRRFLEYQFPQNGRRQRRRRRHNHAELELAHRMMQFQLRFENPEHIFEENMTREHLRLVLMRELVARELLRRMQLQHFDELGDDL